MSIGGPSVEEKVPSRNRTVTSVIGSFLQMAELPSYGKALPRLTQTRHWSNYSSERTCLSEFHFHRLFREKLVATQTATAL